MYQYHSHCWYHLLIHAYSHPHLTAGTMDPQKCLLHQTSNYQSFQIHNQLKCHKFSYYRCLINFTHLNEFLQCGYYV